MSRKERKVCVSICKRGLNKMRLLRPRVLIVSLLAVIICTASMGFYSLFRSLKAEETLHATNLVILVVEAHLTANNGKWPQSWNELEQTRYGKAVGGWRWPDDSGAIQLRVKVDFAQTTQDVLAEGVDDFSAIQQLPPSYSMNRSLVLQLLNTAKVSTSGRQAPLNRKDVSAPLTPPSSHAPDPSN